MVYPTLLTLFYIPIVGLPPTDIRGFYGGVRHLSFVILLTSSIFSPSDCLALISPTGFRRYSEHEKEDTSHTLALRYIKESLTD